MTIRFDDAWQGAQQVAHEASDQGIDTVLVRDVMGRVSLVLDGEPTQALVSRLSSNLNEVAGNFVACTPVMLTSDMFDPSPVIEADDLIIRAPRTENAGRLAYLERTVVGADWIRSTDSPAANRMTLYGFKGGIGRSTATFMLAEHLARQGKCVLAVDLDLESPGLGALAQSEKDLGQHGIVDHLVEAAVGNADGLELVTRSNLITGSHNGEAWLAPAAGQDNANYLAKLNRIYSDLPEMSFATRLDAAVDACEAQVAELSRVPDVVLLDSRAGIHDIAAVALTRLSDMNLLFAVDNPQTWSGYRALFGQWALLRDPTELGSRLKMVSAMTPNDEPNYLDRFRDNAQRCFENTLYQQAAPGDLDVFNYSVADDNAPHTPLPILFNTDLVGLDPIRQQNWHQQGLIRAAFNGFLDNAANLIASSVRR